MTSLQLAAVLAFLLGLGHSVLGERWIIGRLAQREDALPRLFGGTTFTLRTLRFVTRGHHLSWIVLFVIGALALSQA
jgi:hypothetical protein